MKKPRQPASIRLRHVVIEDKEYPYTLRRSRRARNILLHVDMSGSIEVVVPWHAAYRDAIAFVDDRKEWIVRSLQKHARLRAQIPTRALVSGADLPFFGNHYTLSVEIDPARKRTSCTQRGNILTVRVARANQVEQTIMKWYRRAVLPILTKWVQAYANQAGVFAHRVRISNTKTQWGSCNRVRKLISLHWKLALAPIEVARYVVVHEVAHLKVANHSKKFWALVQQLDPAYAQARTWLRRYGHTLTLAS